MTLHLDDARWRTANTARLVDEAHGVDRAWLDDYEPRDPEAAAEKALLDALADPAPTVDIDDAAVIAKALEQWERLGLGAPSPDRQRAKRAVIGTGLLAAGVAAGLLLSLGPRHREAPPDDAQIARSDAPPSSHEELPAEATEVTEVTEVTEATEAPAVRPDHPDGAPEWAVRSGSVVAEALAAPSTSLPRGISLVAAGRLCTSPTPHNEVCLEDGSRFTIIDSGRIELLRGRAHVRTDEGRAPSVQVDDMRVEAEGPTLYVVEHETAGWSLAVEHGAPVIHTQQTHTTVQAGQTLMGKAARRRPRRSAPDLGARLAAARAARAAGDRKGAAEIYEALIAASPRAPLARVATVSLGQLYLELGRPKKARAAFERYLARGSGTLSEDAAFGRLRALRALDSPALERAVEKFLARYPDGAYAPRVRRWSD